MTIAFLYPGQGSQCAGMGADLVNLSAAVPDLFRRAGEVLGWPVIYPPPPVSLDLTLYTQPAIYTVSAAMTEVLREWGIEPAAAAGHSAGEYAALYAAGAWDFETGLRVIAERARLMHETKETGAMAAVLGLAPDVVEEVCAHYDSGTVGVANFNSPKQTVISGRCDAVEGVAPRLKERGARRVIPLAVSGAFHSPLMREAQDAFRVFLDSIPLESPRLTWISNHHARPERSPDGIRRRLVEQFCSPVRWIETMAFLEGLVTEAVEVGPGEVLCGLAKSCCATLECKKTSSAEGLLAWRERHGAPA